MALPAPATRPTRAAHDDALRVLVADDSAVSRVLTAAALAELGHDCETARDGLEALARLRAADWDLVITDLQMPGMDGFGLARALRALPGERGRLPLIALTGEDGAGSRARCLAAGCDAWLAKPVDTLALGATIDRLLDARRGRSIRRSAVARAVTASQLAGAQVPPGDRD
jgi:CheY-like chemotaxis protein